MFFYPIIFMSALPSFDLVLETLRKNTGLDIRMAQSEGHFYCPLFKNEILGLTREVDRMLLWRRVTEESYLFYATIATLITLGGNSIYEIPNWSWKKWGEFTPPPENFTYADKMLRVVFKNSQPSPEMILQKVRENTGLALSLAIDGEQYRFVHPALDFNEVLFLSNFSLDDNREKWICLAIENELSSNYVVESILAALLDLGGEYDRELPPQAWQPWEQAKEYYQN